MGVKPCKRLCRALFCVPYAVDSEASIATDFAVTSDRSV